MYILLIIFHVAICLLLIATILLQAGRGGGLAEAFGGAEQTQSLLGTQAPTVLKRATEVAAILFLVTSLALGMITARRGKSMFESGMPVMPVSPETSQQPFASPKEIPGKTDAIDASQQASDAQQEALDAANETAPGEGN